MIEMVLGILGLIATIVFGILSIDLFKRKRRPCKLTYFPSEAINLYRNLAKGFENLEILKDKQPIKNNIVFMSGVLTCNGDMDITGENHVVQMCLPKSFKWMDVRVGSCSKDVDVHFSISEGDERIAVIRFGLFRINEYIKLQALVEYENEKDYSILNSLHRCISFNHRIENTGNVETGEIIGRYLPLKRFYIMFSVFVALFVGFFIFILNSDNSDNVTYQNLNTGKEYSCMVSDDNLIELHSRSIIESLYEWQPEKITINEFKKQYVPIYKYKQINSQTLSMLFVLVFLFIIGILVIIPALIKVRRINKYYLLYRSSEKRTKD